MCGKCMREKVKDFYILLIIVMVGILIRLPIQNIGNIDTSVLHDPDSYLYARLATEFVSEPISDWEFFTNRSDDPLMNSVDEENDPFTTNLLPMCAALVCKLVKTADIELVIFYFNVILCPLSAITVYIFMKRYFGRVAAIVSGFAMSTSVSYFLHTTYGFFDTDAIIMVLATSFMVCILNSFLEKDFKKQIISSVFSILILLLFFVSWEAYYAYAGIAFALAIVLVLLSKVAKLDLNLKVPCATVMISSIFCLCMLSSNSVGSLGRTIKTMLEGSEWPDESKYIGELTHPTLVKGGLNNSFLISQTGVVNWLGGLSIFLLVFLFVVIFFVLLLKYKKDFINRVGRDKFVIIVFLISWALILIPVVIFGIRFVQLLALPFNMLLGIAVCIFIERFDGDIACKWEKNIAVVLISLLVFSDVAIVNVKYALISAFIILFVGLTINKFSIRFITLTIVSLVFAGPLINEYMVSENSPPLVADDLVDAMQYVESSTPEDSALIAWWDYGYYMQYATNRHTLADGGIYDGAYFYWLSNIFSTEDANLSIGISKMLLTGDIEAVRLSEEYFGSAEKAVEVLKEILVLDKNGAATLLRDKYDLSDNEINRLIDCIAYESNQNVYLVVYDNIAEAMPTICYYGLWDFKSKKTYSNSIDNESGKFKYPEELNGSVLIKCLNDNPPENIIHIYSNKTVSIYQLGSG